jgi:predicted PurR-regulated permease PerM
MKRETVNLTVLLLLVVVISFVFVKMIKGFLMALLLAAILAGLLARPYRRLIRLLRGRRPLAATVMVVVLILVALVPLAGLGTLVTAQAISIGERVGPWVTTQLGQAGSLSERLEALPFYDRIAPYKDQLLVKAGEMAGIVSNFLVNGLSAFTRGTVQFLFLSFVTLYALYFFLLDGGKLLERVLWYLPLEASDKQLMLAKFTSVTRATIKSTAVIGGVQGLLGGLGFWVAGIESALFWGTFMAGLSVIPGLGTGVVWIPAAVILVATNHTLTAGLLAAYFILVVSSVDNVLRPRLVGRDTQLPELLVFLSTIGGISLFGILGFMIGPVIAALFVTIWEIYGRAFAAILPTFAQQPTAVPLDPPPPSQP